MTDNLPAVSPLATAQPTSLDEFFSRDPLDLADQEIDVIVAEYRRQREVWAKAEAGGAKRAPALPKTPAQKALAGPKTSPSLGDLGL